MARPKTPTSIMEARGAFDKHPERRRDGEPMPTAGIGPAPEHMPEDEREIWDEVVSVSPRGVLFNSDRLSLEILCGLVAEWRDSKRDMPGSRLSRLNIMLNQFGFDPSGRAKLSVPSGKGDNPFEDL